MKALVKLARRHAISGFRRKRKACLLPDISKYPSIAILLDKDQFAQYKELQYKLANLFDMKRFTFFVYVDELPKNVLQTDRYFFITKNDFNFWGLVKQEKKEAIISLSFDLLLDMTKWRDEEMTNLYLLTLINTSFRATFDTKYRSMYDMVIDTKSDDNLLNKIEIMHTYLSMLLGKR